MKFASRLKVTASALSSTTLNVGTVVTLGGAFTNCRTMAQAISDGINDPTAIKVGDTNVPFAFDDGSNWMDAYCNITSNTQITITQIISGSNGTGAVTFSGALPTVYNTVPGEYLRRVPVDTFPATFSTTVPLTQIGTVHMPRQTVSGNLTFTAMAGAVRGAIAEYLLILDGTSTLTMNGFTEHGSSVGLLNTSGMPNTVYFWYDGYTYWWSASQAASPVAMDIVAPTVSSGNVAVANATPSTVTVTASEALDPNYIPPISAFAIPGHTVLAVPSVSGTNFTLSVTPQFVNGEVTTLMYTQPASNGLRDLAGNLMATFPSAVTITNNVAATANAITLVAGASSGTVNAASQPFTVALAPFGANYSGTATVTPNDGGAGGTFSPTSVPLTQASPSATFTYTPSTTGPRTIGVTNSTTGSALSNPAGVSYTSNATASESLSIDTIATPQTVGTAFNVTGTWTNVQPTNLDYRLSDDPAGQWTQVAATINANGTWSFSQTPPSASAGRTLSVRDRTNTNVTATSNTYVVNASAASVIRFTQLTGINEGGTSPNFTYTGATTAAYSSQLGLSNQGLQSGVDGSMQLTLITSVTDGFILGLTTSSTPVAYGSLPYGIYCNGNSGAYKVITSGSPVAGNTINNLARANGDWVRLRRTGTTVYAEVCKDGINWQIYHSWTGVPTSAYKFDLLLNSTTSVGGLVGSGLA